MRTNMLRHTDAPSMHPTRTPKHRRTVSLAKRVSLLKRRVPNADTLVRSYPNAGPWDHCEVIPYCRIDCGI